MAGVDSSVIDSCADLADQARSRRPGGLRQAAPAARSHGRSAQRIATEAAHCPQPADASLGGVALCVYAPPQPLLGPERSHHQPAQIASAVAKFHLRGDDQFRRHFRPVVLRPCAATTRGRKRPMPSAKPCAPKRVDCKTPAAEVFTI